MTFLESPRFPPEISYGATGGPQYQTDVIIVNSGYEARNINWLDARANYQFGNRAMDGTKTQTMIAFFRSMKGRAGGFRVKDWTDFQADITNSTVAWVSAGVYQIEKIYQTGLAQELRTITKPVVGTFGFLRNGVPVLAGFGAGQYSIDTTTGLVTMVADRILSISGITKANPGVIATIEAHGLVNGNVAHLASIAGMTSLNDKDVIVTVVDSTHFSIGIDTTALPTYTGGGSVSIFAQANDALAWSGEFDVPCRFDIDQLQIDIVDQDCYDWASIPIIEVRV